MLKLGTHPGIWFRRCLACLQGNERLSELGVSDLVVGLLSQLLCLLRPRLCGPCPYSTFSREKNHDKLKQEGLWLVLKECKSSRLVFYRCHACFSLFGQTGRRLCCPCLTSELCFPGCAGQGLTGLFPIVSASSLIYRKHFSPLQFLRFPRKECNLPAGQTHDSPNPGRHGHCVRTPKLFPVG